MAFPYLLLPNLRQWTMCRDLSMIWPAWMTLCTLSAVQDTASLAFWAGMHILSVYTLLRLDSDLARSYAAHGPAALTTFACMLTVNTTLYASLWICRLQHKGPKDDPKHARAKQQTHRDSSSSEVSSCRFHYHQAATEDLEGGTSKPVARAYSSTSSPRASSKKATAAAAAPPAAADHPQASSYCNICSTVVPLRAHHCRRCNGCIAAQDHHCLWVGTCIGRHNHGRFWLFLLTQVSLAVYALHHVLTAMRHVAKQAWGWQHLVGSVMAFTMLACAMLIGALLGFHTFLIASNQTTREVVKRHAVPYLRGLPWDVSPFDAGVFVNIYNFVFNLAAYDTLQVCVVNGAMRRVHPVAPPKALSVLWENDYYSCC